MKLSAYTSASVEVVFHKVLLELLNGLNRNCDLRKSPRTWLQRPKSYKRRAHLFFIDWKHHSFDKSIISRDFCSNHIKPVRKVRLQYI